MKDRPAPAPWLRYVLGLLSVLAIGLIADALLSRSPSPAPVAGAGGAAMATPTPDDAQRNATKSAMLRLEKQTGASAQAAAAQPSMAEVARKQPRRPDTPVQSAFSPIMGSTPAGPGAIVQVQPPFSNNLYHIENSWYSDNADGTRRVIAYAGSIAGPGGQITDQGVLVVQSLQYVATSTGSEIQTLQTDVYTGTAETGSLRITGADAVHLFLQAAGGQAYRFDLTGRVFTPIGMP